MRRSVASHWPLAGCPDKTRVRARLRGRTRPHHNTNGPRFTRRQPHPFPPCLEAWRRHGQHHRSPRWDHQLELARQCLADPASWLGHAPDLHLGARNRHSAASVKHGAVQPRGFWAKANRYHGGRPCFRDLGNGCLAVTVKVYRRIGVARTRLSGRKRVAAPTQHANCEMAGCVGVGPRNRRAGGRPQPKRKHPCIRHWLRPRVNDETRDRASPRRLEPSHGRPEAAAWR